jgi:glycosyltransferase involved in cell wall biosynthesis
MENKTVTEPSNYVVAFVQKHLCIRGTSCALYDYALANEEICKNKSVIYYQPNHHNNCPAVVEKFKKRFEVLPYSDFSEIKADYIYTIKYGNKDDQISDTIPTLIHSVFVYEPHGNDKSKYALVNGTLAREKGCFWLPHIVRALPLPKEHNLLRKMLKIPENAYVYGRHGGMDTFSVDWVKEAIVEGIEEHKDFYFVFVNTQRFVNHPRIIFLGEIADLASKGVFLDGCDAMIHARVEGETFGLSCAEFGILNKPILTCPATYGKDNEHIVLGKDRVVVFNNKEELKEKLWVKHVSPHTENPYLEYSPENVMKIFWNIMKG